MCLVFHVKKRRKKQMSKRGPFPSHLSLSFLFLLVNERGLFSGASISFSQYHRRRWSEKSFFPDVSLIDGCILLKKWDLRFFEEKTVVCLEDHCGRKPINLEYRSSTGKFFYYLVNLCCYWFILVVLKTRKHEQGLKNLETYGGGKVSQSTLCSSNVLPCAQ